VRCVARGLLDEEEAAEGISAVNKQNWSTIYFVAMKWNMHKDYHENRAYTKITMKAEHMHLVRKNNETGWQFGHSPHVLGLLLLFAVSRQYKNCQGREHEYVSSFSVIALPVYIGMLDEGGNKGKKCSDFPRGGHLKRDWEMIRKRDATNLVF
jgi:hypothetical protein